jgi:hypothetical protein
MPTNNEFQNFYIEGFFLTISPGKTAAACIYFKCGGRLINIRGVELFDRATHAHLGYVYPSNLDLVVKREAINYIRNNTRKWIRVQSGVIPG